MYSRPPSLANQQVNHVAGTATGTVIAAPGADRALRIAGLSGGINRLSGGVVDVRLRDGGGGSTIWAALGLSIAGGGGAFAFVFPEPGFLLGINNLLQLDCISTAATGSTFIYVLYYEDGLTI